MENNKTQASAEAAIGKICFCLALIALMLWLCIGVTVVGARLKTTETFERIEFKTISQNRETSVIREINSAAISLERAQRTEVIAVELALSGWVLIDIGLTQQYFSEQGGNRWYVSTLHFRKISTVAVGR
jgi:hypothetical protein